MELKEVKSSNIEKIGYLNEDLYVGFKSGALYKYKNVPKEKFDEFLKAESKGRYMNEFKKNNYEYERVEM